MAMVEPLALGIGDHIGAQDGCGDDLHFVATLARDCDRIGVPVRRVEVHLLT